MQKCNNCGKTLREDERLVEVVKETEPSIYVCETCAKDVSTILHKGSNKPQVDLYLSKSIIFGAVAGVFASLLWYSFVFYTHFQVGIVAIGVGWLIAQGVVLGAGKNKDTKLALLSVSITLCALVFSQYLLSRHYLILAIIAQGYAPNVPMLMPLNDSVSLVVNSLLHDPLSLVFWVIAIGEAYIIPLKWRP